MSLRHCPAILIRCSRIVRLSSHKLQIIGEPREQPGGLARALQMAGDHKIKTLIDKVMPLSEAAEAHRYAAGRGGVGKVILDPRDRAFTSCVRAVCRSAFD